MEWKPVPGFSFVMASDSGLIRTLDRIDFVVQKNRSFHQKRHGQVLKSIINGGRLKVNLPDATKHKQVLTDVSVLVCKAFHGEPPPGRPWALHKDDNPLNAAADNLYWGNAQLNAADRYKNGHGLHGADHPLSSLTGEQVATIKARYQPRSKTNGSFALAFEYGVHRTTIENIVRGRTWKDGSSEEPDE